MKRKLLLVVMLLCITQISNSQTIDLIGVGIKGNNTSNLTFTDTQSIDSVQVGAIFSGNARANASLLFFDGALETPVTKFWDDTMLINQSIVPARDFKGSYFTATFTNVDNTGVNANVVETSKDDFHSFFAFVYRNTQNATYKSYISNETVWFYQNGSNDAYVYNVPINTASTARNVKVKIPITELANDGRIVVVDITAGDKTLHIEESVNNLGNSFFLGEYVLEGVSGTVDAIMVSVYSPNPYIGEDSGDSFFVSGIVADVDIVEEDPGCTLTQGYWKTHSSCKAKGPARDDTWDALPNAESTQFFLSNQDYCGVFETKPGKGGKYYILAHQYIAAQLNKLNGADPTAIADTFSEASDFLNTYSPSDVNSSNVLQSQAVELGGILDDYNNGIIGPGHCDDGDKAVEEPKYCKVNIYPNPVAHYGTIELESNRKDVRTTVELYNNRGRKMDVLYDSKRSRTREHKKSREIKFNTNKYRKGRYHVVIKEGNSVQKKQIIVE